MARPLADIAHRFDGVHNQIQDYLLQLDAIASNERQALCELCLQRDAIAQQLASCHPDDLEDRFVDVQLISPWRGLLDEGAYAADDLAGSIAVLDDRIEGLPDLLEIRGLHGEPAQSGVGVGDHRGNRLVDFMGNRGRQLPHRRDAIGVRERHLRFAVSPLALAQVLLRLLALGQIEHEGDALVSVFAESRRADKHGHAAAVFPKVLLLESFAASRRSQLCHGPFVASLPFGGRQRRSSAGDPKRDRRGCTPPCGERLRWPR